MAIKSPIELLKEYQKAVYADSSRFIAWIAGRQVGKSFTGAARAVAMASTAPRTDVLIASPSERQSFEAVLKCRDWAQAFDFSIAEMLEERDAPGALMKAATITFPNKSRIIAVPGKPDTVRGYSAHVWMDEFAFFEDPAATWKAILPSISNPLKGVKTAFITSTPNGKSGRGKRFYDIVTGSGTIDPARPPVSAGSPKRCATPWQYFADPWSVHRTPITYAAKYLGTDVEELRRAVDDEEAWRQEFLCDFIDASSVLLPYELIATCEDPLATLSGGAFTGGPIYLGIDFGRSSDPTVCWTLEKVGDVLWTREVVVLKNMNTLDQFNILKPRLDRAAAACIDYTGPGVGFGDLVQKSHGVYNPECHKFGRAELVHFTIPLKCELFPRLRSAFEQRLLRIPADVDVREDLHEMNQIVSNGAYNYTARRTAEGHSDRCTALALAVRAANRPGRIFAPRILPTRSASARIALAATRRHRRTR